MIGVTGSRTLTPAQLEQVKADLAQLEPDEWHIGDAAGVDSEAWDEAVARADWRIRYAVNPALPGKARFAERSTRLVKALAAAGGTLHAWPNKPCPPELKPGKSWGKASGSGTWGTVALAVGLGVKVEMHWLCEPHEIW
ncbi:MAG: hypothetical protein HC818_00040 [Synechococcaceae cyanobacterium RM1_1_27]|nr:hypothetical protein [Synechococcaceae cyanobacterium RM1_1_27]